MTIHTDHPFLPDPEDRDPVRRFRSRLPVPVTIVTSGASRSRAGLTVSSVLVMEGEPGEALVLVSPQTDLWDAVEETRKLVIHVCTPQHRGMAEVFAGRQPSPGGMFAGQKYSEGDWGPVLEDLDDRLFVSVDSMDPAGWSGVVRGRIDRVDVGGRPAPLVYYRGRYRTLD